MDMPRRFKCPECKGDGYIWRPPTKHFDAWQVSTCAICEGHKVVLTDESGCIIGPDAPPRYLCDHGEKLTDNCAKCYREVASVPHGT
jgi:hypothetical protein